MLPEAAQARKAIWTAVDPHTGQRRIDVAFPKAIRKKTQDNEMFIEFASGSTWQVVGSDNYNSLVGSPPVGIVLSEWALADPAAWAYLRPILAENGGWALFIYTPRGRNHGATFYDAALKDPTWFAQKLPAGETGVFSADQLERERQEYIREFGQDDGETRFRQEYLCDFQAAVVGSYYGREMEAAEDCGRIASLPVLSDRRVHTAWDIGRGDSTAIWFVQIVGEWVHVIDYLENSGVGPEWYAAEMAKKPYVYGEIIWPHDGGNEEWIAGSRIEAARKLFNKEPRVMPRRPKPESINGARQYIRRCKFDAIKCQRGIDALRNYRREWDDKLKNFRDTPLHDWASHGADAFAELAAADPRDDGGWSTVKPQNMSWVV